MNTKELEIVRKACIAANPERFKIPEDLPLPVKYDGMHYYWGKDGEMVADFDSGVNDGDGFRIRGWGRIKNEERQDACAKYIEKAINAYSSIGLADVIAMIQNPDFCGHHDMSWELIDPNMKHCWNFSRDDLTLQSPETIAFLASLLA